MRLFIVYFGTLFFSGHCACKLRKSVAHLIDKLDAHKCAITGRTEKLQVDHIVEVQAVRYCYDKESDMSHWFCEEVESWLNTKKVSLITSKISLSLLYQNDFEIFQRQQLTATQQIC